MKKVLAVLLACCLILSLAACSKSNDAPAPTDSNTSTQTTTTVKPENSASDSNTSTIIESTTDTAVVEVEAIEDKDLIAELTNGALVDGKFPETVTITVEIYDRDGALDPTNNMYTDFIKKGLLETYNINVEYVAVPRWTEVDKINNLLAGSTAPDICYTYNWDTIQKYAGMDGIIDLQDWMKDDYKGLFPNLWSWLGDNGLRFRQDPATGTIWAIEARRSEPWKSNTFIRKDWLDKLGLATPTNVEEFEQVLIAFRDNASTLLGADADKIVPFSLSYDVGWRAATLIESIMDPDISDFEYYVNGFDDRYFTQNGTKEAVKILNKWYNEGLIWKDFALYQSGDPTEDDMSKAGYVGAFIHNYDYPFRNGEDSINYTLTQMVGPEAKFVAIDAFKDRKGGNTKYAYNTIGTDRKIFFPTTNQNPLASLLYLDWITDPAHVEFLQIGEEGVTHTVLDSGAIMTMAADDAHKDTHTIMSLYNIDYTMTTNGLRLATPELTQLSKAYGYDKVDPQDIIDACTASAHDARSTRNANVGVIEAEGEAGASLNDYRDAAFCKAVVASEANFDAVWQEGMDQYLAAGGQDIIDERTEAWKANYGSATMIP